MNNFFGIYQSVNKILFLVHDEFLRVCLLVNIGNASNISNI